MTPAHKNKLLNPFLAQINHPDPLIRASSLSNLGEVCKNLRFSLTGIASEIFNALHQVIQFDKAVEVRIFYRFYCNLWFNPVDYNFNCKMLFYQIWILTWYNMHLQLSLKEGRKVWIRGWKRVIVEYFKFPAFGQVYKKLLSFWVYNAHYTSCNWKEIKNRSQGWF